jgi:hypothetical protein
MIFNKTGEIYLEIIKENFTSLKTLAEKSFKQIGEKDFFYKPDGESNSIAIIIQHMSGNMVSRWTDFLTTDGEKPLRNRDNEFIDQKKSRLELMQDWEQGWKVLFDTINSLHKRDLLKTVYIRGEKHTVLKAINRQVSHYAYHVGQIVYIAKHLKTIEWDSLSIPKKRF